MTPLATGLVVCAAVLAPAAIMAWLAFTAPLGFEDEDGFYLGEPDEHADPDSWGV